MQRRVVEQLRGVHNNSDDQFRCRFNGAPIGVGGVGGSGTRVVADLLHRMGIFMAGNVNNTNDNFVWPHFRRILEETTGQEESARRQAVFADVVRFETEMDRDFREKGTGYRNWFWKVPTSFYWLHYLDEYFPQMKYIHVMRHGLDMAFSTNRNQFKNWSHFFNIRRSDELRREEVLEYWICANQHAIENAQRLFGDRFKLLRFEDVCLNSDQTLRSLAEFVDVPLEEAEIPKLRELVKIPTSIGRYRQYDFRRLFSSDRIDAVVDLGYTVED